jgi:hypothetical protein
MRINDSLMRWNIGNKNTADVLLHHLALRREFNVVFAKSYRKCLKTQKVKMQKSSKA